MTGVTIEQNVLRNAVSEAVEREAHIVLHQIIANGVEFEAVRNCVLVWSVKTRGIAFAHGQNVWVVQRSNGIRILNDGGEKLIFRSFHELLQWLFDQPDITADSDALLSDDDFQIKHRTPHRWEGEQERKEWFAKHGRDLNP